MPATDSITRPRRAFTLIEITAVLAIMGMLIAVAAVSLKDVCRAARIKHAKEQLVAFDRRARDHAAIHGTPTTMTVNLDDNSLVSAAHGVNHEPLTTSIQLGTAARIDRIRMGRRTIDYGRAKLHVSDRGATATYAVRLLGSDGSKHWLLFAGMTGQTTQYDDDRQIDTLFDALTAKRIDTH